MLQAADTRLTEVRRAVPDAGAMVIATDQSDARAYGAHLRRITGQAPTVVLSDDDGASARIEEFSSSDSRWMVAVRMVSEGVDVPRLAVGVYATSTATPLFFAQAVGRFVRARRRGETASVFLPSVPQLLALAGSLEDERDHALDRPSSGEDENGLEDGLLAEANQQRDAPDAVGPDGLEASFKALEAQATFDRVLFDGGEFGTGAEVGSAEELDFLGLPGLLDADQVTTLLRERQAGQAGARGGTGPRGCGARARRVRPPPGGRAAQGAAEARVGVGAQERAAARQRAHRAAAPLRRTRGAARDRRPARGARRAGPELVRRQALSRRARSSVRTW
ncbi:hypothetical protein GCM10025864_43780 [Luteimicrobium album]|uniref:Helicase C-terminal domain-containing protein n=1 Tax=Luteimicrobium album TaxID=1054550 RepID=A0ABQ6I766_9MICO|nr:hypothetical protein GCM10025864_43780 [Luteimicrobium album]